MPPIKPDQITEGASIPDFVFDCFNCLIEKHFEHGASYVYQEEAISALLKTEPNLTREAVFSHKLLNVEGAYIKAGWKVEYHKPGYDETWAPYFVFRK